MRPSHSKSPGMGPTYRIGLAALLATLLLIMVGGFTRGSGSGFGCADSWPLCADGVLGGWLPRADFHMIVEWSHRWLAAMVGLLAIATAVSAWRHHRDDRAIPWLASVAVATIAFQAWIGRAIVLSHLDADLVSLHLAISLSVAALLASTVVLARIGTKKTDDRDRIWPGFVVGGAGIVFAITMLGSLVHNLYFPGWPLMFDRLIPGLASPQAVIHFTHRLVAGLYVFGAIALWMGAQRRGRPRHEVAMLGVAATLFLANVGVGSAHVLTKVSSAGLVVLHLGLASTVWVLTVAAAVSSTRIGPTSATTPSPEVASV